MTRLKRVLAMAASLAVFVAIIMAAPVAPMKAADPLEQSKRWHKEATQNGITAVDPAICGGKVTVYIYDNKGFTFSANHPVQRICANAANQILVPRLTDIGVLNNRVSSARVRNAAAGTMVRFYANVNYQTTLLTLLGNRDEPDFSDYGADNFTSSIKRIN